MESRNSLFLAGTYKFIQKHAEYKRKSMIFVKLTDSALRALNEYLINQNMCHETPKIEFTEDSRKGFIEIPTSSKGDLKTKTRSALFKFNLESNVAMQGRQGSFECIKRKRGSKKIRKCGPLTKRLKIHANDDIFETTKNRMAEVELEQKKICTKEIDLKLETVNRQVRIEKNKLKSKTSVCTSSVPVLLNPEIGSIKPGLQKSARIRNKYQKNSEKLNSPIARRPLKERIIHMLAVRPLRKIELSAALRRDGLRDADKNLLNSTLMSVATMKDNVYCLLRHMWNDVMDDWSFYSEEDRQKMQKNKQQNLAFLSNCSTVSSNLSPKNSSLGDRSPSRPGYIKGADGLPTKRQRISHFNRPSFTPIRLAAGDTEKTKQISPSRVTNGFDDIIEKFGLSNSVLKTSPLKLDSKQCSKFVKSEIPMASDFDVGNESSISGNDECHKPNLNAQPLVIKSEVSTTETTESVDTTMQLPLSDFSPIDCSKDFVKMVDFTEAYITITDTEQRRRYKNDFIMYYNEYVRVNEEVMPVALEFEQLKERYLQYEKGSLESSETERQIIEKYNEVRNTDYHIKSERHRYLHSLLSHIKKLVREYDVKYYQEI